ncbi:MAG: hypothetical protein K6D02_00085 [Lachnospiraceae bacterium]|nr:hypothetical protein [Lachnospiraceae bacterium]
MKGKVFKKMLGILMMFALVVSSVGAIGGVEVAEAAEETTVSVWSGNEELYNYNSSFYFNYDYTAYASISKFSITYQLTDSTGYFILKCNNENIGGNLSINSSGTIDLEFPAEMLSTRKNNGNLEIGGINMTVTDISVTGVLSETGDYTPGQLYTQKTDVSNGVYSQRWVCLVSEDDLASTKNATFTITRGDNKKMTKTVTTAYKSVVANNETISFDGYYWVCYAMKNIPEGVTLTGTVELNK